MKLLELVRLKLRARHYAYSTEKAYVQWIERFIRWHAELHRQWRHPKELGAGEVEAYLSHLANERHVSKNTQNQSFSALLFLYRHVIQKELGELRAVRATKAPRMPTVLTKQVMPCRARFPIDHTLHQPGRHWILVHESSFSSAFFIE